MNQNFPIPQKKKRAGLLFSVGPELMFVSHGRGGEVPSGYVALMLQEFLLYKSRTHGLKQTNKKTYTEEVPVSSCLCFKFYFFGKFGKY